MKKIYLLIALLTILIGNAQSVRIVDSENGEAIPFANIQINNTENLLSNGEGYFSLPSSIDKTQTTILVSYLGYNNQQISLTQLAKNEYQIKLTPATFSLDTVIVPNKRPDPHTMMAEVNKRLNENYKGNHKTMKNTIFYRESSTFKPSKLEFEIDKSSGFTKKQIAVANSDLDAFSKSLISHPPKQYTDVLCNYYTKYKQADGKFVMESKLEVLKATKLQDENRATDMDALQKGFGKIVLQHLDTTKFYRIKSGWFGSKDTISLRKGFATKNQKKKSQINSEKSTLTSFMKENNPANAKLDFITNHKDYDFEYEGALYSAQQTFVYVLSFKPRKGKAKYSGKVYISENDYAIVRADYNLVNGKTLGGINLKMVLGVKASENVSNGTLIYKQNPDDSGYYLQYASVEDGQYVYLNRPLKFIELTKEEKDVVAFDIKIELNTVNRFEFLNMERTNTTETSFDQHTEKDFAFIPLKKYNPELWKEYNVIEPLAEMKRFKVGDQ